MAYTAIESCPRLAMRRNRWLGWSRISRRGFCGGRCTESPPAECGESPRAAKRPGSRVLVLRVANGNSCAAPVQFLGVVVSTETVDLSSLIT